MFAFKQISLKILTQKNNVIDITIYYKTTNNLFKIFSLCCFN